MKAKDIALCLFVTAIWGANFTVIRLGLDELDPFLLTSLRFVGVAFPMVFFIRLRNVAYRYIVSYGLFFGVGLWGMVNLGMHFGLSAGMASLFLQLSAFFSVGLACIFFREQLSLLQVLGAATAFFGLSFILWTRNESMTLLGSTLVLLGALSWSVCNMIVKYAKPTEMLAFVIHSSVYSAIALVLLTYATKGFVPFFVVWQNEPRQKSGQMNSF